MPGDAQQADIDRYERALHAMQTGVATEQGRGSTDGSPKHLRVGVNSAKVEMSALATALIEAGVFTRAQYIRYLADAMEAEVAEYERRLTEQTGVRVRLL